MKKIVVIIWLLVGPLAYMEGFETVEQAHCYAQHLPEYLDSDNNDVANPDYTLFYKQLLPPLWKRLLQYTKTEKAPVWQPKVLLTLLTTILGDKKRFPLLSFSVVTKYVKLEDKIIIFGKMYGEFHSLVRGLLDLVSRGILSNTFKILNPRVSLVFMGNAVNKGAYSLEILTLIVRLIERNPEHVIYLAGQEEHRELSELTNKHTLGQELAIRAPMSRRLLTDQLLHFFDELPFAALIKFHNDSSSILLSALSFSNPLLKDALAIRLLQDGIAEQNQSLYLKRLINSLKVIIVDENDLQDYSSGKGLYKLAKVNSSVQWTTVSSPIKEYRMNYGFFYDAYVELTIGKALSDSTLTLYHQDTRRLDGFKKGVTYNLISGQLLDAGQDFIPTVHKKLAEKKYGPPVNTINLGSSMDLSKGNRFIGKPMLAGISLGVNQQNQKGGINGRKIKFIALDDSFIPYKTYNNMEILLKRYKTNLILYPLGSPTLEACLNLIKNQTIFVFFPQSGASLFRNAALKNIVHFRVSLKTEGKALTEYMLNTFKMNSVAILYENDIFGLSALEGVKEALKATDIKPVIEVPYTAGLSLTERDGDRIKKAGVEAICFCSTGPAMVELVNLLGIDFIANRRLYAISPTSDERTVNFFKGKNLTVIRAHVVPDSLTSTLEIVKEYRHALTDQTLIADPFSLEGYIVTDLTVHILKNVTWPITHEKLRKFIESIKNYTYKGLTLTFNPETRQLANYLWIDTGKGKWIEMHP
jgi:branched-chain amino acid transport system substrate-binding protein